MSGVFNFVYYCFERCGIVHGQVGKHLTVDFDAGFVDEAHEAAVREVLEAGSGVDTLYPEYVFSADGRGKRRSDLSPRCFWRRSRHCGGCRSIRG